MKADLGSSARCLTPRTGTGAQHLSSVATAGVPPQRHGSPTSAAGRRLPSR